MKNKLVRFDSMEWEQPKNGMYQKYYSDGKKRLRLVRFDDDFIEEDWCQKGHVGFVLKGEMTIDFNGDRIAYGAGDGLLIEYGECFKHKVLIEKGKQVELILFESDE